MFRARGQRSGRIATLIARVIGHDAVWGVDLAGCETALLRAMLAVAGQSVVHVPGRTVKTMAATFPGEAKTDARLPLAPPTDLLAQLALLNRLRHLLLGISPVLERTLTLTNIGTLILLTGYQTPHQLRLAGRDQIIAHLRHHRALHVVKLADTALAAAAQQDIALPGHDTAAGLVA